MEKIVEVREDEETKTMFPLKNCVVLFFFFFFFFFKIDWICLFL